VNGIALAGLAVGFLTLVVASFGVYATLNPRRARQLLRLEPRRIFVASTDKTRLRDDPRIATDAPDNSNAVEFVRADLPERSEAQGYRMFKTSRGEIVCCNEPRGGETREVVLMWMPGRAPQ